MKVRHVVAVDDDEDDKDEDNDDDDDDDDDDDEDGDPKSPTKTSIKKKFTEKFARRELRNLAVTHKSSVNCCVIDPNFASRRNRFVMFGGHQSSELVLHCLQTRKRIANDKRRRLSCKRTTVRFAR